jgi:GNAT superfamily N-acetyltransferase
MTVTIRSLTPDDYAAWHAHWQGYLTFYETVLPPSQTELTWSRLIDPVMPLYGLAACDGDRVIGITHYLFHLSTWTAGEYCYLQDLFTAPDARGKGVARALIGAVRDAATARGAARLYWQTQGTNATARALYDKVAANDGFVIYKMRLTP